MPNISATKEGGRLLVTSPYDPAYTARAKSLGGKWDPARRAWAFDVRDETRVRAVLVEVYGEDGSAIPASDRVTMRIRFPEGASVERDALRIAGREVASASGRDTGARLGPGVVMEEGRVDSGGSRANWTTYVSKDTVLLLRDVPRGFAERVRAEPRVGRNTIEVELIEGDGAPAVDREALAAERERLLARLAEINAVLGVA